MCAEKKFKKVCGPPGLFVSYSLGSVIAEHQIRSVSNVLPSAMLLPRLTTGFSATERLVEYRPKGRGQKLEAEIFKFQSVVTGQQRACSPVRQCSSETSTRKRSSDKIMSRFIFCAVYSRTRARALHAFYYHCRRCYYYYYYRALMASINYVFSRRRCTRKHRTVQWVSDRIRIYDVITCVTGRLAGKTFLFLAVLSDLPAPGEHNRAPVVNPFAPVACAVSPPAPVVSPTGRVPR